jgi:hypothetical protein
MMRMRGGVMRRYGGSSTCEAMLGFGKVLVYILGSSGGVMRLYVSDELLSVIDQEQKVAD